MRDSILQAINEQQEAKQRRRFATSQQSVDVASYTSYDSVGGLRQLVARDGGELSAQLVTTYRPKVGAVTLVIGDSALQRQL